MSSPAATSLTITQQEHDQRPVLVLTGGLDATTAPQLASLAVSLVDKGARDIIVDASGLTSCDADGLSVFIQINARLRARAGRLALAALTPAVRQELEASGHAGSFVVAESIPAALYAIHRDHP
jgi:Anti-anti-sigma regulatory factor (antagonist of anti-sigma factor)